MKSLFITVLAVLTLTCITNAQQKSLSVISINGIVLCQTNIDDLKQKFTDIKEADVEEMDLQKGCYGQDSRFIAGHGFASEKLPGMIFQKSQTSDFISKVRLNKQFIGTLPDGKKIDMNNFLLKDLFQLYPQFKSKWGSRGCSDYWNFSNDTLSFYVSIDKSKHPQFPIDEDYYMNKPVIAVDIISSCYEQENGEDFDIAVIPADPLYFVDSIQVYKADLIKYNPQDIAMVRVYKGNDAIKVGGPEAKNGVIFIETKAYDKKRYWNYFKSKSAEYAKLVPSPIEDSNVQYILNKKVLKENYEGDLASINDELFKEIQIINKEQLIKEFGVKNKDYGIIIISNTSRNLKNGKDKF
ncbi:hypothetical protein FFF34_004425 [Inquilinus sp. KBS0705]|nr:hypothetical protein FFF34_004425 [Inquilinus sp. KBS0705]